MLQRVCEDCKYYNYKDGYCNYHKKHISQVEAWQYENNKQYCGDKRFKEE